MYITYDEVVLRYPIIKTWGADGTIIDDDLIYYAERELNGRLASHFTVPFEGSHPTIKDLAIDLVYYRNLRMRDPEKAGQMRQDILGRIEDLKAGKEYIYTGSGTVIEPNATAGGEIWSTEMDYHPVHSMLDADDASAGIDPDRLDDERDERD